MSLKKVCLAISSFRNDAAVLELLESVCVPGCPFESVLVVDSLGTAVVPRAIEARGWSQVQYHSFPRNLGSAGNLAARLRLAAETGAEYVYALNHDGRLVSETVETLVEFALNADSLGAVYPLRRLINRGNSYDLTGVRQFPLPTLRVKSVPTEKRISVYWSSSNGALYNLAPVREGLLPFEDLWMGWEDLGYGWMLHKHGWRQYVIPSATAEDPAEFRSVSANEGIWVTDKPDWYAYYFSRNLLLISKWTGQSPRVWAAALARILVELPVTVALRKNKLQRLGLIARGVVHGLRSQSGKWALP